MTETKTESNVCSTEKPAEKKSRLRIARDIAEMQRNFDIDEKYFEVELLQKGKKTSGRDIYLEYAKIILQRVLTESPGDLVHLSQGSSDIGQSKLSRIAFAVSNMADRLTKDHIRLYP